MVSNGYQICPEMGSRGRPCVSKTAGFSPAVFASVSLPSRSAK
jgi:hypothetical protein